jgi:fucose permease
MTYRHSLVFASACVGMLLFGVTLTTIGAVLPSLMPRYGMDRTSAGSLLSIMSLGILTASLVFGPIVDLRGYKGVLIAGALGVMLGLEGIANAPSAAFLAAAVFVFGFSGGILNGATNALVSDISEAGRGSGLSLLGIFFGIGAFGVPLVLGLLLDRLDVQAILAGIGLGVLVPVAMFVAIRFPPPKQPQGLPIRKAGALMGEKTLLLLGLMLFCQSGMEITLGGWSSQFVHEALELDESRSVLVLSVFWIGMTAARLVMVPLLKRWSARSVLVLFWASDAIGFLLLWLSRGERTAMLGLFLFGFGLAAVFPVILGVIGEIYKDLTGTAFSIAFVLALLGGSALPLLTGFLADRYGLRFSLQTVPFAGMVQILLFAIVVRPGETYHHLFTNHKDET